MKNFKKEKQIQQKATIDTHEQNIKLNDELEEQKNLSLEKSNSAITYRQSNPKQIKRNMSNYQTKSPTISSSILKFRAEKEEKFAQDLQEKLEIKDLKSNLILKSNLETKQNFMNNQNDKFKLVSERAQTAANTVEQRKLDSFRACLYKENRA